MSRINTTDQKITEIFSNTLATLVLYNTSLDSSLTFQSLTKALEKSNLTMDILIYDNSMKEQVIPRASNWAIQYIHNPTNPGVGKAYNTGFDLAVKKGKKWLLHLDQDTNYPINTFEQYAVAHSQHQDQEVFIPQLVDRVGLASPLKWKNGGGIRISITPGKYLVKDFLFHNCGLLISVNHFKLAGGYDERFPLDFSDFSFVERLRRNTSTFVVTSTKASHELATTSTASLNQRLVRFESYAQACKNFRRFYRQSDFLLSIKLFLRALKLGWAYKSFQFLLIYLKT